jgi:hypothetical protein
VDHSVLKSLAEGFCSVGDADLTWDYDLLADLREGTLWIDLRGGETFFNGEPLPQLFFPTILRANLSMELGGQPSDMLEEASLKVQFTTERYQGQRNTDVKWAKPWNNFVSFNGKFRSRAGAGGVTATATSEQQIEWPYRFAQMFPDMEIWAGRREPRSE